MKICFLAPADNYHIVKWCKWFADKGNEVYVISFTPGEIQGVKIFNINSGADVNSPDKEKIKYLFQSGRVRRCVQTISPDVISVHYATSYGTVAALARLKKYALSVWGSDIYEFPNKSILHKMMLKYSLRHAAFLFSTSQALAGETSKYRKKNIYITPFGVDMNLFHPDKRNRDKDGKFVIGNIKALNKKYGIDVLLKAAHRVIKMRPDINLEVRIAGRGVEEDNLKNLAEDLGISDKVVWIGFIQQSEAAKEWANMDIGIISSIVESFGVSAVEAQASGIPVIISDIPGLKEATNPGITSRVVSINDYESLSKEIIYMYDHSEVRCEMAIKARSFVEERYEIDYCFEKIESLFQQLKL